jgi:hypothetical protein
MRRARRVCWFLVPVGLLAIGAWAMWLFGFLRTPSMFCVLSGEINDVVPPVVAGPWPHGPVDRVALLHGRTMRQIETELGPPNSTYEFSIGGSLDEFRCELMNVYPPHHPRSAGVRITEWTWQYAGFTVTLWFHRVDAEWIVLDSCRWKDGVAF